MSEGGGIEAALRRYVQAVKNGSFPVESIHTYAEDGLALSSRNGYLDASQRLEAGALSRQLSAVRIEMRRGRCDWSAMEEDAMQSLAARGWQPDYVAIRRCADLGAPVDGDALVVLAAARIGATRLIDNLELVLTPASSQREADMPPPRSSVRRKPRCELL